MVKKSICLYGINWSDGALSFMYAGTFTMGSKVTVQAQTRNFNIIVEFHQIIIINKFDGGLINNVNFMIISIWKV